MTPLENLLTKLPDAKRVGKCWSARCPAHEDRRASLSMSEGDSGGPCCIVMPDANRRPWLRPWG